MNPEYTWQSELFRLEREGMRDGDIVTDEASGREWVFKADSWFIPGALMSRNGSKTISPAELSWSPIEPGTLKFKRNE